LFLIVGYLLLPGSATKTQSGIANPFPNFHYIDSQARLVAAIIGVALIVIGALLLVWDLIGRLKNKN
jgi:hypothetical protein